MAIVTAKVKAEIEDYGNVLAPIWNDRGRAVITEEGQVGALATPEEVAVKAMPRLRVKVENALVEEENLLRGSESPCGQVIDVSSSYEEKEERSAKAVRVKDEGGSGSFEKGRMHVLNCEGSDGRGVVRSRSEMGRDENDGMMDASSSDRSFDSLDDVPMPEIHVDKKLRLNGYGGHRYGSTAKSSARHESKLWTTAMGTPILSAAALGEQTTVPENGRLTRSVTASQAAAMIPNTAVRDMRSMSSSHVANEYVDAGNGQGQQLTRPQKITCRQFWHAGEYEAHPEQGRIQSGGMDHVRVHPKFLHSNATSHKWALGAMAELLDNAVDEIINGATFVQVDKIVNPVDGSAMLLIEDDGGGMAPDRLRQCMSLGYSAKSKSANMIGQYGNGFKTSTMRLGADVIVFTRCTDRDTGSPSQSIGMLSYTFLRKTGHEDIIVPMVDFELPVGGREEAKPLIRTTEEDWASNLETITQWSPYRSLEELLMQAEGMGQQGTRVVLYNLWENDEGDLELDFETDPDDIQIRGGNRDEKRIALARKYPASRMYLTYRHSLRSYASILYLRRPNNFQIILRGKEVQPHNILDDLMHTEERTYRPHVSDNQKENQRDSQLTVVTTIGFVKDAPHVDISGFSVYHKNRLIKPFWRVWSVAGSGGRGVIGLLEANFVEPAHDKQGFERTLVLQRLEQKLNQIQKQYWNANCTKVGYHPNRKLAGVPPSIKILAAPAASPRTERERSPSPIDVRPHIQKPATAARVAQLRSSLSAKEAVDHLRSLDANTSERQHTSPPVVQSTDHASEWSGRTRRTASPQVKVSVGKTANGGHTSPNRRRGSNAGYDRSGLEELGRMVSRGALARQNGNSGEGENTISIEKYTELEEENKQLRKRCSNMQKKKEIEQQDTLCKIEKLEKALEEVKKKMKVVAIERDSEKKKLTQQRQDVDRQIQNLQRQLKDVLAKLKVLELEGEKMKENMTTSE